MIIPVLTLMAAGSLLQEHATITALNLVEVANLSPATSGLVFSDTDHDGRNEVICSWRDTSFNFYYLIQEEHGNNDYVEVYRGAELHVLAAGDLDHDGKSDLVGAWGNQLQVYESTDASTHPSEFVWSTTVPNFIVPTVIADTDGDGNDEIIYFRRTGPLSTRLTVFECRGDNSYIEIWSLPTHNAESPVIGDFDGDGRIEIAYCGQQSGGPTFFTVVESSANDSWSITFSDSTGLTSGAHGQGGLDTDGNGRKELFFSGSILLTRCAVVYEPVADNLFERVASLYYGDNSSGQTRSALGNIDGAGMVEYLMDGSNGLQVFKPVAAGTWVPTDLLPRPAPVYSGVYLFDVNQNGVPELFRPNSAADEYPTVVFEQKGEPTSTSGPMAALPRYTVGPIPTRGILNIRMTTIMRRPTTLRLLDAAGRLVDQRLPLGSIEQRIDWRPRVSVAGVYFLRLENPDNPPETKKLIFVR